MIILALLTSFMLGVIVGKPSTTKEPVEHHYCKDNNQKGCK